MITKREGRDVHGTKNNPTKALETTLNLIDLPRRYFVGIVESQQSEATEGVTGRQGTRAVYNLETAPPSVFDAFFKECNATCKANKGPVTISDEDRVAWEPMTRWWALNEVLDRRGTVAMWEFIEVAQRAMKTMQARDEAKQAKKEEVLA